MEALHVVTEAVKPRPLGSRCWLDRVGMWLSLTCAVHCALLPFVLAMIGFGWFGNELLEFSIIFFSFMIASIRLTYSYFKEHRRPDCLFLFFAGATSILLAKAEFFDFSYAEALFMTLGGMTIATAHWRNHQLAHEVGAAHVH